MDNGYELFTVTCYDTVVLIYCNSVFNLVGHFLGRFLAKLLLLVSQMARILSTNDKEEIQCKISNCSCLLVGYAYMDIVDTASSFKLEWLSLGI